MGYLLNAFYVIMSSIFQDVGQYALFAWVGYIALCALVGKVCGGSVREATLFGIISGFLIGVIGLVVVVLVDISHLS